VFIIEELGMIGTGTFNVGGGAFGDGAQLLDGSSAGAAVETLVTLAQCFGDGARRVSPVCWAMACASR
jgi:hypothetical protein